MVELKKFKELLATYIAFKSISTDNKFKSEIKKTVKWLKKLFTDNNFKITMIQGPNTNPVIVAKYHQSDAMETVLVYGHYDVQPTESQLNWTNDPFELTERNDRWYGRGVVDNKGQNLVHILTVIELIKQGKLAYNVTFMLEGNEETGNEDMSDLIKNNIELLRADIVMISDGEMIGTTPTIESSLRGGANARIVITGAPTDFHSGINGGAVPNAGLIASHVVAKLKNIDGYVNIPGFYDGVKEISERQRADLKRLPDNDHVIKFLKIKGLACEPGLSFYEQIGLRPTIEISGLGSGYTGEGFQNIIPAKADIRVNFRFVMGQDKEAILRNFETMVEGIIPSSVAYTLITTSPYRAVEVGVDSPQALEIRKLITQSHGEEPVLHPVGAGIPIVSDFQDFMGIDTILVSLGNEDCNMHGEDENWMVKLAKNALKFSWNFFSKGAK